MKKTSSKKVKEEWVYSVDYGKKGVLLDDEFFFVLETSSGVNINPSSTAGYYEICQGVIHDALESYSFDIMEFKDEDSNDEEV